MIIQMISAGESSGQLDAMLQKVMEYYKMRFDAIIDGLSEAIEPIMLFMIAAMVILLALGIFLPMWEMGNAVQGRR
jgi:general secretion pathway protein F